ncbi:MAG: hypothetical protein LLF94_03670 [Chlamydiales bacterium]|nr:hypothetical protein [Chlamydiales bacterium]
MNTSYLLYLALWLFSSVSTLNAVSSNSIVQPPGQVVQSPQGDLPYQPYNNDDSCRPNNDNYHRDYYRNDGYNSYNRYDGYHQNNYHHHNYNNHGNYQR